MTTLASQVTPAGPEPLNAGDDIIDFHIPDVASPLVASYEEHWTRSPRREYYANKAPPSFTQPTFLTTSQKLLI